ncbi:hypothetical protein Efla_001024 [Eimeria flavescens]
MGEGLAGWLRQAVPPCWQPLLPAALQRLLAALPPCSSLLRLALAVSKEPRMQRLRRRSGVCCSLLQQSEDSEDGRRPRQRETDGLLRGSKQQQREPPSRLSTQGELISSGGGPPVLVRHTRQQRANGRGPLRRSAIAVASGPKSAATAECGCLSLYFEPLPFLSAASPRERAASCFFSSVFRLSSRSGAGRQTQTALAPEGGRRLLLCSVGDGGDTLSSQSRGWQRGPQRGEGHFMTPLPLLLLPLAGPAAAAGRWLLLNSLLLPGSSSCCCFCMTHAREEEQARIFSPAAAHATPPAASSAAAVLLLSAQQQADVQGCTYGFLQLLAARRSALKLTAAPQQHHAEAASAAAAAVALAGVAAADAQLTAEAARALQQDGPQRLLSAESSPTPQHLADVAAFRVAARPPEVKGPPCLGAPRTLSAGGKEAPASPYHADGAAEVLRLQQPAFCFGVNSCPDLQALHDSGTPHEPLAPPRQTDSRIAARSHLRIRCGWLGGGGDGSLWRLLCWPRCHFLLLIGGGGGGLHACAVGCVHACSSARQRLVCLAREAGPGGLPLSQVLQRHLCVFNCLLEPRALGFEDLGALVRSAWPALQLRASSTPHNQQQQQQQQKQAKSSPQAPEEGDSEASKKQQTADQPSKRQQQQHQEQQQQADKEKQQEQTQQRNSHQAVPGEHEATAEAAATDEQQQQQEEKQQQREEQQQQGGLSDAEGPVVVYVRPLLSLEAHLFSNLLFALIADAAAQHQQQQQQQDQQEQQQQREAAAHEAPGQAKTAPQKEPFAGVPFAALPRLWQEKYGALADLRHFQAAAGARDLCAFLEGLPEVTLQRREGALLLSLVEGVAVPEGPQYIPNELSRPALVAAVGGGAPLGSPSALMQLPSLHGPAVPLLPGPTLLEQQQRRAAAPAAVLAASAAHHHQQQLLLQQQQHAWQQTPWTASGSTEVSSPALADSSQQLCLQAAQTLLKHLQQQHQQQAVVDHQDRLRGAGPQRQQQHAVIAAGLDRRASQAALQQLPQQQQEQLRRLLRGAVDSLGEDSLSRRRLLKSIPLADEAPPRARGSVGPSDLTPSRDVSRASLSPSLQQTQQQQAAVAGVLAELLASQKLSRADSAAELQRQLGPQQQQQQQQQQVAANSSVRMQLRRRLLGFVRAACKQQRLQWHRNEDLTELLVSKQQQQQVEPADEINPQLRPQLLLLLQLDGQLQLLQQQQEQQQQTTEASGAGPVSGPPAGQEQSRGAAAAAVRRCLLRLLASPAVTAARSRHRLRTVGASASSLRQAWKQQYGESLSQRLEEAGLSFAELVESEPHLFVLGAGRALRIATRQHLEEFGLLPPADAAAAAAAVAAAHPKAAALDGVYAGGTPTAAKPCLPGEDSRPAGQTQPLTDQQLQRQLLLLLLQQVQQQQQQQQAASSRSFAPMQEPQQLPQHPEQVLQLLQCFLSATDSRGGPVNSRGGAAASSESPPFESVQQPLQQQPAAANSSPTLLRNVADYTRPVASVKSNVHRLVYVLVAKLCQQQHAKHLLLRMQCETALQQEQPQLLQLQQQGRWKAAQDTKTLADNGIVGVRLSELSAEWRRLYGCELEAPMRQAGYPDVLSLVSAVPGLFVAGEGADARCLVSLPTKGPGQPVSSRPPVEEPQASGKGESPPRPHQPLPDIASILPPLAGGCDHIKSFAVAHE